MKILIKLIAVFSFLVLGYVIYGMLHRGPLGNEGAMFLAVLISIWLIRKELKN